MPPDPLDKWLGENQDLFIKGYFGNRMLRGDSPTYYKSTRSLPEIPAEASMEVITGFISALRAQETKKELHKQ